MWMEQESSPTRAQLGTQHPGPSHADQGLGSIHGWRLVTQATASPAPHWSPRATLYPATPLPRTGAPSYSLWATLYNFYHLHRFLILTSQMQENNVSDTLVPTSPGRSAGSETDPKSQKGSSRDTNCQPRTGYRSHRHVHMQTRVQTQTRTPSLWLLICRRMAGAGAPKALDPRACDSPHEGHRWCLKTGLR